MKRGLALLLSVITVLAALTGCSKASDVEKTIDAYMKGVVSYDSEAFENELFFESQDDRDLFFWGLTDDEFAAYTALTDLTSKFTIFLREAASRLTYTIDDISENGDKAEATLSVSYVNGSDFAVTALERMYSSILGSKLDGTEYDKGEILYTNIYNMTYTEEPEFIISDFTVSLVKTNGAWKIVPNDDLKTVSTAAFYKNASDIINEINKYASKENN